MENVLFDDEQVTTASNRGFLAEEYSDAKPRPPVVTVMGHVDHGKTTLLDTIRQRSVAAEEAGGITQRIGAYTVEVGDDKATFIDTPGHEAFTAMRARGAQVTDIAVLVVAADDGVMPQTREAIAHARAAEVPIIVAINKIDVPQAKPDITKNLLAEEGLIPEEWGGSVPMVECSAKKNIGIDDLLEIITLTAQVQELKARYDGPAGGVVLESAFDPQKGSLATLLVQRGTLRVGDCAVAGTKVCRVRSMQNEAGKELEVAEPSTAIQVIGFDAPPEAGDQFEVYPSIKDAREVAEERERQLGPNSGAPIGFMGLTAGQSSDKLMRLAVILKTDSMGTIAAVKHMFNSMKDSKYINLRWVLTSPGPITDSDVELASTCPKDQRVMVVGFNTPLMSTAEKIAKAKGVEVKTFKIIYELFDWVVAALQQELGQEEKLVEKGRAEVLAVFPGRFGKVAGCRVTEGQLLKGKRVKVFRNGACVGQGPIISLRSGKNDVDSIDEDNECGFSIDGWEEWEKGDEVRCFDVTMVTPELVASKEKQEVNKASRR